MADDLVEVQTHRLTVEDTMLTTPQKQGSNTQARLVVQQTPAVANKQVSNTPTAVHATPSNASDLTSYVEA